MVRDYFWVSAALLWGVEATPAAREYRECGARVLVGRKLSLACDAKRTEMPRILTHFDERPRASIAAGHGVEMVLSLMVSSTTESAREAP